MKKKKDEFYPKGSLKTELDEMMAELRLTVHIRCYSGGGFDVVLCTGCQDIALCLELDNTQAGNKSC
jgi:hypothetical protein